MVWLQLPGALSGLVESELQQKSSAFSLGVLTVLAGAAALFAVVYLRTSRKGF